jgi:hypothetical protein
MLTTKATKVHEGSTEAKSLRDLRALGGSGFIGSIVKPHQCRSLTMVVSKPNIKVE